MKRLKILVTAAVLVLAMSVPTLANAATSGNGSISNQSAALLQAINTGDATVTQTGPTQTVDQYQYAPVNQSGTLLVNP